MNSLPRFSIYLWLVSVVCFSFSRLPETAVNIIGNGNMPNTAVDQHGIIHVVFGRKDSIFYSYSADKTKSFSKPLLITVLPSMYSFAMRGPQIASTNSGLVITAMTKAGNIYTLTSSDGHSWSLPARLNDADSSAPEGLMSISASGNNVFAVWLDVRGNRRNKIYGALSRDGGVSWMPDKLIYQSPDTTVCECCKPSVVMKGDSVYVMFRNWLDGNRDLYLVGSADGGRSFGDVSKLGTGSWKLNGCPMDGGGIGINDEGVVQTVWRRGSKIYRASPGGSEWEIGEGKGCTMATINDQNLYAWQENGELVIVKPGGEKLVLGTGTSAVLKKIDNGSLVCVWENENQIRSACIEL